jgi:tritrans,polycis-undecaprenyl-diphosphate synthase [geranylgeranyl-diphosphate specific]
MAPEKGHSDISQVIADTAYLAYERRLLNEVKQSKAPKHIAIIMDGNRRFALEIGLRPLEGHEQGRNKLEELLNWGMEVGTKILTVYAFSTENWRRDEDEVRELMRLFEESFYKAGDDKRVHKNKISIKVLGLVSSLPENVQKAIAYAEGKTAHYDNYRLNLAIAYGGREEIIQAIKEIAARVKSGKIDIDDIDDKLVSKFLYGRPARPGPDIEDERRDPRFKFPPVPAGIFGAVLRGRVLARFQEDRLPEGGTLISAARSSIR